MDLPLEPEPIRHDLATRSVTSCAYFDHHPGPHAWTVTDPRGGLIARHIHSEVRRLATEGDNTLDKDGP
ncbi:hypothetical protein ACFVV7_00580 [Streptomyces globisporus]|uniref:hypothetical protein n=1 Tax=Streptomyces globisporus TaxID=1908 RepID=UPI0036DA48E5